MAKHITVAHLRNITIPTLTSLDQPHIVKVAGEPVAALLSYEDYVLAQELVWAVGKACERISAKIQVAPPAPGGKANG